MPGLNGGRGLTIQTDDELPPVASALPPDSKGPNGTPRRGLFTVVTTPNGTAASPYAGTGAVPRSWLQSPRKWANNRTPTNAGGDGTPNSKRQAAYYGTLQQNKTGDQLFGKEEEEGEGKPAPVTPTSLASLVHQTDKNGKQQQAAAPLPQQQQQQQQRELPGASMGPPRQSGNPTLWGRFVGSLGLNGAEGQAEGSSGSLQGGSNNNLAAPDNRTTAEAASSSSTSSSGATTPNGRPNSGRPLSSRKRMGLLGDTHPDDVGKKCLVLDLDETLVHSSFQPVEGADFVIPVKIEDTVHKVYVLKRPGVDEFMERMGRLYEIVIFTASLSLYADPLLDKLDIHNTIRHRLFRESCTYYQGNYVKDMTKIDRDIDQIIIVDNSPLSFMFQPENAIGCSSYIDDPSDRELDVIGDFLEDIKDVEDVRDFCRDWRNWGKRRGQTVSGRFVHAG